MPCNTRLRGEQTLQDRIAEVDRALKRLEAKLKTGEVRVQIGPSGAVAFAGWGDRDDVTDVCAYRSLMVEGSWALRQAVARAEALSGRRVDLRRVAAGVHSHDGGGTWHGGH